MLAVLIVPGAVAYAGFFSFFGDIYSKVITQEKTINSQNVVLLAAVGGPDFSFETHFSDINTVGESAILPEVGPSGGLSDVDGLDSNHGQISIYVVHEGDSLSSIGEMFGVSVNTILWANSLQRGTKIQIGQTLVILPVSGVKHIVKKGDTLASIAKKYSGDIDEIRSYNGIEDGALVVGDEVIIPDGEVAAPVVVATKSTSAKLSSVSGPAIPGYYQVPFSNYRKTQGLHGYNGVDLVSTLGLGAPVMAAAKGTIIISRQGGYNGGYGSYVVIQHGNGTQTLYGHLQSVAVSTGEIVAQGQTIGKMGNTGRSTGPHLHFEVRGAKNPF
ncbi:MAG: Peptidase M23 family protein [Parcubacteria group bacterium GW2011_GWA2_47_7]|nr:MAG: Peptidase M23 family protein [Parcubacteria group bacterium GW2011_GWA2_47_7]